MPTRSKKLIIASAFALLLISPLLNAHDRDNNPPGLVGGLGTNWENPPGSVGGWGSSPDRRHHHVFLFPYRHDHDNNPPGLVGGRGTNWENPPGLRGGPGSSPNRWWR